MLFGSDLFISESIQLVLQLFFGVFGDFDVAIKLINSPFILRFKAIDGYCVGSNCVKLNLCVIDTFSEVSNCVFNFLFIVLSGSDLNLNCSLSFDQAVKIIFKSWDSSLNCLDIDSSLLNNIQKICDSLVGVILPLENGGSSDIISRDFIILKICS